MIARALIPALRREGYSLRTVDVHSSPDGHPCGDILEPGVLSEAISGCAGVIHLAAVSRVCEGEADPTRCRQVNVAGTRAVINAALASPLRPWLLFTSSREVYGQPGEALVSESVPIRPVNHYGRSKAAAEALVEEARAVGLPGAILRLTNIYGRADDHPERVVLAFARAAVDGQPLRLEGPARIFDFLHIEDAVEGIISAVKALEAGRHALPPIQLVSGSGISLEALASLAVQASGGRSRIVQAAQPASTVSRFVGDPARALALLGWKARMPLEVGIRRLIHDLRSISLPVASNQVSSHDPHAHSQPVTPDQASIHELQSLSRPVASDQAPETLSGGSCS